MALDAKVVDIAGHPFGIADKVLLDTNVLMLVFGTNSLEDSRVAIYSSALHAMHENGSQVYCSGTILSEFVYAHTRRTFEINKKSHGHKELKHYLSDPSCFTPLIEDTRTRINSIRRAATMIDSSITARSFDMLFREYEQMAIGFNDVIIAAECRRMGCWIATDDVDFARNPNLGIPVLTATALGRYPAS